MVLKVIFHEVMVDFCPYIMNISRVSSVCVILLSGDYQCYRTSCFHNPVLSFSHGKWARLSGCSLLAPLTKKISSSSECSQRGKGARGCKQQP